MTASSRHCGRGLPCSVRDVVFPTDRLPGHAAYAATVHGAFLSGLRAAEEIDAFARRDARVIVIGAGVAGLAAARRMQEAGHDVVVLEGRDDGVHVTTGTERYDLSHHTDEPVLLGFNAGSYARALEPKTDAQVVADAMDVLRIIYG